MAARGSGGVARRAAWQSARSSQASRAGVRGSTQSAYRSSSTSTGVVGSRAGAVNNRVYFRGAAEMRAALARIEKATRDEFLAEAVQAAGDVLADEWRIRAPEKDGNYKAAIEAKSKAGKTGATGIVRVGNAPGVKRADQPRRYAARLEFGSYSFGSGGEPAGITYNLDPSKITRPAARRGSRGRKAQPSLRPAFDAVREQMVDAMGNVLRRLIEGAN